MDIYADVCCLNRPFDDQTQDIVRLEAEAVLLILKHVEEGDWYLIGSEALEWEIDRTPDTDRKRRVKLLASAISHTVSVDETRLERAQELQTLGLRGLDALHIACAEGGRADVFLTTDKRLLRAAARLRSKLGTRVANPLDWLREMAER